MSVSQPEYRQKTRPNGAKPRYRGQERKAQILGVATGLFGSSGYQSLKMTEIATACGITKPVLYSHFPSKDALFEAALNKIGQQLNDLLITALINHEGQDQSLESLQALMSFVQQHNGLWAEVSGASSNAGLSIVAMMDSYRDQVAGAITKILAARRPTTMSEVEAQQRVAPLAHALLGAADGGARWWRHEPDTPIEETQRLSRLVLDHFMMMARSELGVTEPDNSPADRQEGWRNTLSHFID
ncbi:MAG: TetR/AcrR family transcriptional regulator [Alphaproteobacteria bacterium]